MPHLCVFQRPLLGFLGQNDGEHVVKKEVQLSQSGVCVFRGWRSGPTVAAVQN